MKALALVALVGCGGDLDEQWQLSHDRIIAVRATPPHIVAGDTAVLDGLIGFKDAPTQEASPLAVAVVSPQSLAGTVAKDPSTGAWTVTAPSDAELDAARAELELMPGTPVPLQVGVVYPRPGDTALKDPLTGFKTVFLGDAQGNPALTGVMIDGKAPGTADLVVAPLVDVPLALEADDSTEIVNWVTSCGTMHDFDLAKAYVRVEKDDPQTGELGVVLRDGKGGVAWQIWKITAQP